MANEMDAVFNIQAKNLNVLSKIAQEMQKVREAAGASATLKVNIEYGPDGQVEKVISKVEETAAKIATGVNKVEVASASKIRSTLAQANAFSAKREQLVKSISKGDYSAVSNKMEAQSIALAEKKLQVLSQISRAQREINKGAVQVNTIEGKSTFGTTQTAVLSGGYTRETKDLIAEYNRLEQNPAYKLKTQGVRPSEFEYQLAQKQLSFASETAQRIDRLAVREIAAAGIIPTLPPAKAEVVPNATINTITKRYYDRLRELSPEQQARMSSNELAQEFLPGLREGLRVIPPGRVSTAPGTGLFPGEIGPILPPVRVAPHPSIDKLTTELSEGVRRFEVLKGLANTDVFEVLDNFLMNMGNSPGFAKFAGSDPHLRDFARNADPLLGSAVKFSQQKGEFIATEFAGAQGIAAPRAREIGRTLEGLGVVGPQAGVGLGRPSLLSRSEAAAFGTEITSLSKATQRAAASTNKLADAEEVAAVRTSRGLSNAPPGGGGAPPIPPVGGGGGSVPDPRNPNNTFLNVPRGSRVRSFSSAFQSIINYAGAATLVYGFSAAMYSAAQAATQFEERMARLRTVLPGQNLSDFVAIRQDVLDTAQKYGIALTEVADAAQSFVQEGRSASQVADDLSRLFSAVTGLGINSNEAKELLVAIRTLTDGKVGLDVFERIADITSRSAVSANDLVEALKTAGPVANELRGQYVGLVDEIDLVVAATGQIVQRTGLGGTQVATSLRNTFSRLGRPEVVRALQGIGDVKLGTPESGGNELRPLYEILQELSKAYEKLKNQGRTADLQRLLTTLSGSRQTNVTVALLEDYAKVQENAEHAAQAFAETTFRTNTVLDTTAISLARIKQSFNATGFAVLQSVETFDLLSGALKAVQGVLNLVSDSGRFAVPVLLSMAAAAFGLFNILKVLGTAFFFVFGSTTLQSLEAITAQFGAMGRAIATVAISSNLALEGGFFAGLAELVGPGGILVLATAAVLGLIAAIRTLTSATQSPLALTYLTSGDIKPESISQYTDLAELAKKSGESIGQLYSDLSGISRQSLDILAPIKNLNRDTLLNTVYPKLRAEVKGFADEADRATKGLDDNAKKAKEIELTMALLAKAAFLESGVYLANYNHVVQQLDALSAGLTDALGKLQATPLNLTKTIGYSKVGPITEPISLDTAIENQISAVDEKAGALVKIFFEAGNSLNYFTTSYNTLDKELKAGAVVTGLSALAQISENLRERFIGHPEEQQKFIDDVAKRIRIATQVDTSKEASPLAGIFSTQVSNISNYGTVLSTITAAIRKLENEELTKLGGKPITTLQDLFQNTSSGAYVSLNAMRELLTGTKNPFTEFIQNLYLTQTELDLTAAASRRFGLTFDAPLQKVNLFSKALTDFASLPVKTLRDALKVQEEIQQLISVQASNRIGSEKYQRAGERKAILQAQVDDYVDQLKTLGVSLSDTLLAGLSPGSPEELQVQEFLDDLKKGLVPDQSLMESITRILSTGLTNAVANYREALRTQSFAAVEESITKNQIATSATVQRQLIAVSNVDLFGASPEERRAIRQDAIEQQRVLDILVAEAEYEATIVKLRRDAASDKLGFNSPAYLQGLQAAEDARVEAKSKADTLAIEQQILDTDKEINALAEEYQNQIVANTNARLSGLRDVLTDFDKLTKGKAVSTILGSFGEDVQKRQIDLFLKAFSPDKGVGIFKDIGTAIGGLGEENPILEGHTQGAAIVYHAIVKGHSDGALLLGGHSLPGGLSANIFSSGNPDDFQNFVAAAASGHDLQDFLPKADTGTGDLPNDQAKKQAAYNALAAAIGIPIGEALGKQQHQVGPGDKIGSQLGSVLGSVGGKALGSAIFGSSAVAAGTTLGSVVPVVGTIIGAALGGLIGGLFDHPHAPVERTPLDKIERNTREQVTLIQNTNRLLELSGIAFNVPASFKLPRYGVDAFASGGVAVSGNATVSNNVSVAVNIGNTSANAAEIGKMVAEAVSSKLNSEYASGGRYVSSRSRY